MVNNPEKSSDEKIKEQTIHTILNMEPGAKTAAEVNSKYIFCSLLLFYLFLFQHCNRFDISFSFFLFLQVHTRNSPGDTSGI